MKKLKDLFGQFPFTDTPVLFPDIEINDIAIDSRVVKPGNLFVAMQGEELDGHDFIDSAIKSGAVAVVGDKDIPPLPDNAPYIKIKDTRQGLTWLAAAFHDWPARKLTVIGVTGTDGKTTTTNLIFQILRAAGLKSGMVSTVNAVIGESVLDTGFHVTTPDAQDLQRYLAEMVEAGLTHVVLETTSHGWAQHRVDACEFDIAVVTNITHEHLDEHGSYENYRAAKARLFSSLEKTLPKPQGNPRLGVLNRDDRSYEFLDHLAVTPKLSFGIDNPADVRAEDIAYDLQGMHFTLRSKPLSLRVLISTKLVGKYNISNCLAAFTATVFGLNVPPEVAAQGINQMQAVPGRMERIDMGQKFIAIVDFAHTPNALKVTLETGREMLGHPILRNSFPGSGVSDAPGRLIAVFGSAGLRDRQKRRMMAETSARLADLTILTAEDPRTESLDFILKEMAEGARRLGALEGQTFWRIPDRGEAIRFAVKMARPGDMVLYCGKGHEQSMCFGRREHLWDDRTAMQAALAELLSLPGPAMPYLPTQDTPEEEWLLWK